MANDLNLKLRIEAAVKGVRDVQALGKELQGLSSTASKKVTDPTEGIGRGARAASADVRFLTGVVQGFVSQLLAVAGGAATIRESVREIQAAAAELREVQVASGAAGVRVRDTLGAAARLAADDLVSVGDATRALSTLLRQGFGLDVAERMLARFKDEALLVSGAQEDVGKSMREAAKEVRASRDALEEYAAARGRQVETLTEAEQREAAVAEEMRRTQSAAGAAARGVDDLSRAQNALRTSVDQLQRGLGEQLSPTLTLLTNLGRGLVEYFIKPALAGFATLQAAVGATVATFAALQELPAKGFAQTLRQIQGIGQAMRDEVESIKKRFFAGLTSGQQAAPDVPGIAPRADRPAGGNTRRGADASAARFSLARAQAEAELKIQRDALARQGRELEVALADNLVSYRTYYAERARLREQEIDAELAARRRELAAAQTATQTRDEGKRLQALANVATLEADIYILEQRTRDAGREASVETARAERELADALARVREELAALTGSQSGAELRAAFERDLKPLIDRARAAGQDTGPIFRLIDARTAEAELRQIEGEFARRTEAIATAEQAINVQRNAGLITETQARQRLEQLYQDNAAALAEIARRYEEVARASGLPDAIAAAERMRVRVLQVSTVVNEMALRVQGEAGNALAGFFSDIATGAKSFGDAMTDALRRFRDAVINIIAQRLGQQLVDSVFSAVPKGGGGGGGSGFLGSIGSFFSGLFKNHTGGVVGGAVRTRAFANLSPLAIAAAPRFHSGGEVLSVLQAGEEVLTADDPRHRRNGGGVKVVVNLIESPGNGGKVQQFEDNGTVNVNVIIDAISNRMAQNGAQGRDPYTQMLERRYRLNPAAGGVR